MTSHKILACIFIFFPIVTFSQIKFEKGYFVDNNDIKTTCFIKNRDWNNNPVQFEYKIAEDGAEARKNLDEVKEFGIDALSKYVRADVAIDRSPSKIANLTNYKAPKFYNERLFVKVLLEGIESLYIYEENGMTRFFFKNNDNKITQLVYKQYSATVSTVLENAQFRNQLWNEVRCAATDIKDVEKLAYTESSLINYFKSVNNCTSGLAETAASGTTFEAQRRKGSFNLKGSLGYRQNDIQIANFVASDSGPIFGVEAEYILPTNKNKWGIVFETSYNSVKAASRVVSSFGHASNYLFEYDYLELSLGIRHYFFLTDVSKIFITGALCTKIAMDSEVIIYNNELTMAPSIYNFGIGVGYNYKIFSVEFKFNNSHPIILEDNISSDYTNMSVMLRCQIFNTKKK